MKKKIFLVALIVSLFSYEFSYSKEKSKPLTEIDYYNQILSYYENQKWEDVYFLCHVMQKQFAHSSYLPETYFYWGISSFYLKDYGKANECLSQYLKMSPTPKFFDQVLSYKFAIAELYREGERKHLLGWNKMPRWLPSEAEAIEIYDEVIASLPHHDLAAKSLYGKGVLLHYYDDYKQSVETLELLVQRFPKHHLSSQAFVEIGKVYLSQANNKQLDPTLIDQSEINLRKFHLAFPSDEKIEQVEKNHQKLKGAFADGLYEIGAYYKRASKNGAAKLYFEKIISDFPLTEAAKKSSADLKTLKK